MNNLQFFDNFIGNFAIFWKFFSKFSRKFMKKFRKFWKYAFVGVQGTEPPEASEIIKNLVEKSMETCKLLKILMTNDSICYLKS